MKQVKQNHLIYKQMLKVELMWIEAIDVIVSMGYCCEA